MLVYVLPWSDDYVRMGRFLMNVMLAAGGQYLCTVVFSWESQPDRCCPGFICAISTGQNYCAEVLARISHQVASEGAEMAEFARRTRVGARRRT